MHAILLLIGAEYKVENLPSDMVKVLCVDADGVLKLATIARLMHEKWISYIMETRRSRGAYIAMVDVDVTGKGVSHCYPIEISADEFMVINKIVDLVTNHADSIPKDGKIPKEWHLVTSGIIKSAINFVDMQKEQILNKEKNILANTTTDEIRYSERTGIPTKSGFNPAILKCPSCNCLINPGQLFCTNCGIDLRTKA